MKKLVTEVEKIIKPISTSHGAGVYLKRSSGSEPNYLDTFLMLDEFGSENKDDEKTVKLIAGKFKNAEGPIKDHNVEPIYFDIELIKNKEFNINLPSTHNSFVYLVKGEIKIGDKSHENIKDSNLILLTNGEELKIKALTNAKFLLISGKPIGEPIARGGAFVMNTKAEILQAVNDYQEGTFVK